jgi:homoserine dehydrogenase
MAKRVDEARTRNKALWYNGIADLNLGEYSIGFKEIRLEDPISSAKESDNIIKIYPRNWQRPVIITGPGAGIQETVTGMISGLRKIELC